MMWAEKARPVFNRRAGRYRLRRLMELQFGLGGGLRGFGIERQGRKRRGSWIGVGSIGGADRCDGGIESEGAARIAAGDARSGISASDTNRRRAFSCLGI